MAAMSCLLGSHMAPGGKWGRGGRAANGSCRRYRPLAPPGRPTPPRDAPPRPGGGHAARTPAAGRGAACGRRRGERGRACPRLPVAVETGGSAASAPAVGRSNRRGAGGGRVGERVRGVRWLAWGGGCFAVRGLRHGTWRGRPAGLPSSGHLRRTAPPAPLTGFGEKNDEAATFPSGQVIQCIIMAVERLVSALGLNRQVSSVL